MDSSKLSISLIAPLIDCFEPVMIVGKEKKSRDKKAIK